jgi:hypothetical protein
MKCLIASTVISTVLLMLPGCTKNSSQSGNVRTDADAKARAEGGRKEMETLPKIFRTPNYLKKNEPTKTGVTTQASADAPKK